MSAPKGRRTGRCAVCAHPERYRLELLIVSGAGRRAVAQKFDVRPDAVYRHAKNHISAEQRTQLIGGPLKLQELVERANRESIGILDYIAMLRSSGLQRYFAAAEAGDTNGAALLMGRLTDLLRLQGQFTGELARAGSTVTNNIAILASPLMSDLQAMLIERLAPYPEARTAVIQGLEQLSARALQQQPVPRVALPGRVIESEERASA